MQWIEALELWVEDSELALKAVVEKEDADSLQSVVAPTQLTLKLSFYDLAPMSDVPSNGSKSSPSCGWCTAIAIDTIREQLVD